MIHLLFLCTSNSVRSQMAEGYARARAPADVTVVSAGTHPADRVHPVAVEVMAEVGIDISAQRPAAFSALAVHEIDVAVTLCANAAEECALVVPGHPPRVDWNLSDPARAVGDAHAVREAFRRSRDEIRRLVDDLFGRGYLKTLALANSKAELLLDSLSEGIIAHDLNRRILYFNRAAETISGYSRGEVLGRDCHEVFPGGFCGGKCCFRGRTPHPFDTVVYPLEITTRNGEKRHLEMTVRSIADETQTLAGILASFRDLTREHDMARRIGEIESFSGMIGRDKTMLEVFDMIRSVADADVPVMIQGESGTGKELVAAAIHNESPRAGGLFVPVNCGALPEGLLESELFGHVRGAFTGAIRDKKGRFELADRGSIFLDEIGDVSPPMQVKLLRVLQDGAFERVGGERTIQVDARVISATNKDLRQEIAAGRFREDLYYRLCVVPIHLPPLHERCGDIPLLVDHIIKRIASETGRQGLTLSPTALDALLSYEWPGNVRELQNALQFALVKCKDTLIEWSDLPPHVIRGGLAGFPEATAGLSRFAHAEAPTSATPALRGPRKKLSATAVRGAMHQTNGNKVAAARALGVSRATLYRFLNANPELVAGD